MASLTPEQRRLQARAVELDKAWQNTFNRKKRASNRARHNAVVDRLILLAFPPDGMTDRTTTTYRKPTKEAIEDADNQGAERGREVQEGREANA